jgi:hypothetical protein
MHPFNGPILVSWLFPSQKKKKKEEELIEAKEWYLIY